ATNARLRRRCGTPGRAGQGAGACLFSRDFGSRICAGAKTLSQAQFGRPILVSMSLKSINPATDELVREYPEPGDKELAMILAEASCAAAGWRRTSFADRAPKMRRAADLLDERKEELARLMAIEMGKPLVGGRSEAEKCAWVCRYYADN